MDITRLYENYSIRYAFNGERHFKPGWINIPCPFCTGHSGNHLGFNQNKKYFRCWRCGHKPITKVLCKLLGISYGQAKKLVKQYKGRIHRAPAQIKVIKVQFKMPDDTGPLILNDIAMQYMQEDRGFSYLDTRWVAKRFNLYATGMLGDLDDMDLSFRIVAPIFHENEIVSWQSRDYTNTSNLKYVTCPGSIEIIGHKKVLYNAPDSFDYPVIVLCEGIIDVWKVFLSGFPATCCFGVEYTSEQFRLLAQYKRIIIFMDPDQAGRRSAKRLKRQLIFAGKDAHIINNSWEKDPGDMTKSKIKDILNPIFKGYKSSGFGR